MYCYGQLWHAKTFIANGYYCVSNETNYPDNGEMLIKFIKNENRKRKEKANQ